MSGLADSLAEIGQVSAALAYERIADALWLDPPHDCTTEDLAEMIVRSLRPENERLSLSSLFDEEGNR